MSSGLRMLNVVPIAGIKRIITEYTQKEMRKDLKYFTTKEKKNTKASM